MNEKISLMRLISLEAPEEKVNCLVVRKDKKKIEKRLNSIFKEAKELSKNLKKKYRKTFGSDRFFLPEDQETIKICEEILK